MLYLTYIAPHRCHPNPKYHLRRRVFLGKKGRLQCCRADILKPLEHTEFVSRFQAYTLQFVAALPWL